MNNEYSITESIKRIEDELMASMIRNLRHHRAEEIAEGYNWEQWQVKQLEALERYKKRNARKYLNEFKDINQQIGALLTLARQEGDMSQEIKILNAIKNGFKADRVSPELAASFFLTNDRKLEALINATVSDMGRAETAILRMANDKYRRIIFDAQMYANSGAGTYEKAVDMATLDMRRAGLNCVEYKNGARHTLSDYADMAIRTASKRAYLYGEGEKRQEWGIGTVIMVKRGNPCPKCAPFVGKVLIDDVWSGGSPDGKHKLMSDAIKAGLYHPRCKDSHTTYFEGITEEDPYTDEEREELEEEYNQEQKLKYAENQAEKFGRLAEYSLDEENRRGYEARVGEWEETRRKYFRGARFRTGEKNAIEYANDMKYKKTFEDVTEEWFRNATPNSHEITILDYIVHNDMIYEVDGKNVILDPKPREYEIAEILKNTFGGRIAMRPRVNYPQNIPSGDYEIRGEIFDLKTPETNNKHKLYNMTNSKKKQSNNFIYDISICGMSVDEAIYQIENDVYASDHTRFVKKIILIKDSKIIKVYSRK